MSTKVSFIGSDGKVVKAANGRTQMQVAPGYRAESIQLEVRVLEGKAQPAYSLSGQPFQVVIELPESKSTVQHLEQVELSESKPAVQRLVQPITIQVAYDPAEIRGDEQSLTLFAYDEETRDWLPLPTQVDTTAKVMTAQVSGSTIMDYDTQDWEAARLPSLASFQTSLFTGAAAYSMPLEVPPDPGGLQPSLVLSYNSQVVDGANSQTQAAWVGMGWSLDTGYIQRNINGSMSYLGDDTFSLMVAGMSSMLLPGEDGYYHTTDENFWRSSNSRRYKRGTIIAKFS